MTMRISKDRIDMDDKILRKPVLEDYGETVVTANTGSSYTIDLRNGNVFDLTLTNNCTFTFSNPPASGTAGSFTLLLTNEGGKTVTWPGVVEWPADTAPTLSTIPGGTEVLNFFTFNGVWYGSSAGYYSPAPVSIVDFSYTDFSSTTGISLLSCSTTSNEIYLTTAVGGDVGNAIYSTAYNFQEDFSVEWNMEVSGGSGADGFTLQWTVDDTTTGGSGGSAGKVNDSSTIHAISFKTWGTDTVYWYENNSEQTNAASTISIRQNLFYWADYDHSASTMEIFYSTTDSKPGSPDHTFNSFSFGEGNYHIGFGAGTGGANDDHRLKDWALSAP